MTDEQFNQLMPALELIASNLNEISEGLRGINDALVHDDEGGPESVAQALRGVSNVLLNMQD